MPTSEYICHRHLLLKLRAVEYLGGRCLDCGYDRYYCALEFHHRDPSQKELVWAHLRKRSWTRITHELDKCDLLCATCHRERHQIPELVQQAKDYFANKKRPEPRFAPCAHCGTEFKITPNKTKFCSKQCVALSQRRINWPNNLPELVANSSLSRVSQQLGVSDKAVKKRLVKHHQILT